MPLLEQVLEKYPNDAKLVYKNFPLRNHKMAEPASVAAMAASRQGKFWEYHDEIFLIYNRLTDESFDEIAKKLSLDMDRFNKDRKDPAIIQHVKSDAQEGAMIGVRGTPTIFINGKRLGQRSIEGFSAMIDEELAKLKK
jgi:protein-disulfide isomerase